MKIAICISGHVRNMLTLPIIEIIEHRGISYDVYVSSWNTNGKWLEPTTLPYDEKIPEYQARLGIYEHERVPIDTSIFNGIKNIKKYEVEDDTILNEDILNLCERYKDILDYGGAFDIDREIQRKYQIFSMFRKCQRSIDMIDDPENYDFIIRTRFDAVFDMNKVIDNINHILSNGSVLIPSNFEFGGESAPGGGRICDSFAIGNFKSMGKYAKMYDFFKKPETLEFLKMNKIWFCPHSLLRQHLILENVVYEKIDMNYDIIRDGDRNTTNYESIWNKK